MIAALTGLNRINFGSQPGFAGAAAPAAGADASGFAAALSELASDTVGSLQNAETLSFDALQGRAETREVVDAVMTAEQALQASIAIRDKIVTSFLEISRMAI